MLSLAIWPSYAKLLSTATSAVDDLLPGAGGLDARCRLPVCGANLTNGYPFSSCSRRRIQASKWGHAARIFWSPISMAICGPTVALSRS